MLQICQDNDESVKKGDGSNQGLEWDAGDMQSHQDRMLSIMMQ